MVSELKADGKTVALIPTMGALHEGHLSLVEQALGRGDTVVASVFVNPVQFNNAADLETYPRNEEADFEKLHNAGVTAVFAPSVSEIYPDGTPTADSMEEYPRGNSSILSAVGREVWFYSPTPVRC